MSEQERYRRRVRSSGTAEKSRTHSSSNPERSTAVMVRNLYSVGFDSNELENFVSDIAIEAGFSLPTSVTIPVDKSTGVAKGFAFIDFPHEDAAIKFMEWTKGVLKIDGGHFPLVYSQRSDTVTQQTDWSCVRCQFLNYSRRNSCKVCGIPRDALIPAKDSDNHHTVSIKDAAMRTLQLCPGLVPDGEKYYTDDQDRQWLFDPDTLYWYNKRRKAYYRVVPDDETILRRVDDKGVFVDSKDVPLPARTIPHRPSISEERDPQPERKRRADTINEIFPLTKKVVVVNPSEFTTCFICSRTFDSVHALRKHENLSELHRDNLRKRDNSQ